VKWFDSDSLSRNGKILCFSKVRPGSTESDQKTVEVVYLNVSLVTINMCSLYKVAHKKRHFFFIQSFLFYDEASSETEAQQTSG
jgi:hypothetical protein